MESDKMPLPPSVSEKSEASLSETEQQMPMPPSATPVKKSEPKDIKVKAIRLGFFAQERKYENMKFVVPTFKQLGSWMECEDPAIEKLHQAAMQAKKKKANTAAD